MSAEWARRRVSRLVGVCLLAGAALMAQQLPAAATAAAIVRVTSNSATQLETYMAMSSAHPGVMVVAYTDFRKLGASNRNTGYAYATNGGATASDWSKNLYVRGITQADATGLRYQKSADPVVVYSRKDDTFKMASLGTKVKTATKLTTSVVFDGSTRSAAAATSGLTWHTPVAVATATQLNAGTSSCSGSWLDKEDMAVDNNPASPHYGRVYLTWTRRYCKDAFVRTYVSHHDLGTPGWSTPVRITGSLGISEQTHGPAIGVGGTAGVVYVAACASLGGPGSGCSGSGQKARIDVWKSSDGGGTWSGPLRATPDFSLAPSTAPHHQFRENSHPHLSVDRTNGHDVAIAYTHELTSGLVTTFYVHSSDGGAHWSTPVNAGKTAGASQYFPYLARSPDGTVMWLCYLDERYSTTSHRLNVSCAKSTNATSFQTPLRVTASSFGTGSAGFIGDYNNSTVVTGAGRYRTAWAGYQSCCPGANIDVYAARQ